MSFNLMFPFFDNNSLFINSSQYSSNNAYIMSEFSRLAYVMDRSIITNECNRIGFDVKFFYHDDTEAHVAWDENTIVVFFRGTQLDTFADLWTSLAISKKKADTHGFVHCGFKESIDDVWDDLFSFVETLRADRTLFATGHSLGAALATIFSSRVPLTALYTFGSPRVGDKLFVKSLNITHYRMVNANDFIVTLPPAFLGYRHDGALILVDKHGNTVHKPGVFKRISLTLKNITWKKVFSFKWWLENIFGNFLISMFDDHDIINYSFLIKNIKAKP